MQRDKWYWALIIMSLIVLASPISGCTLTATSQGSPSPPVSSPNANDISNSSLETGTATSPITDTTTPSNETVVGNDPVSGRNEEVDLNWEALCLSSQYQVQIAKDPGFTIIVLDTGAFTPSSDGAPGAYYPAGGRARALSALTPWAGLESGHIYYWRVRVRQAATGQYLLSPWSEVKSFTVESGLPASNPSHGLQSLYPNNGRSSCPVTSASFAWSPLNDTSRYRFVLAKDAAMAQIIKEADVTTTAYEYDGTLDYGQSYFWRVMALEPAPSDWSATFSFQTEVAPLPPPAPQSLPPETPLWAWVVIAIGLAMLIVMIFLIFRARRR